MALIWCTTCGEDYHLAFQCKVPPERAARMLAEAIKNGTLVVVGPGQVAKRSPAQSAKPASAKPPDHHVDKLDDVHPDPPQDDRPTNPKLPRRQRLPRQNPVNRVHPASEQKSAPETQNQSAQGEKSARQGDILSPPTEKSARHHDKMSLPESLTKWRAGQNVTIDQAAQALGVTHRTIIRWEKTEAEGKPLERLVYLALAGLTATS